MSCISITKYRVWALGIRFQGLQRHNFPFFNLLFRFIFMSQSPINTLSTHLHSPASPTLPLSPSPLLPFSHSPLLSVSHSPLLPFSPSPTLPFSPSPTLPFSPSPTLIKVSRLLIAVRIPSSRYHGARMLATWFAQFGKVLKCIQQKLL